eukprot:gnl/TRDRNA2_/TRDRNA2_171086_c0_seq4.p1 gnl/TRDRNA2_/TRDRNA2_171086_c0~~gnl/TRDRNA2_/TRDRNA2_171086_c0_seq4.p1  ORF type:complete len:208 (-),score=47.12 gnl/TRDRNA2_/TRDRNA2_171086_c0_seq4:258-881(-)
MVFGAARGIVARAARQSIGQSLRPASAPLFQRHVPVAAHAVRTYVTVQKYSREEMIERLNAYHSEVLSTNWGDYLQLVYNVPFWEAEYEKLSAQIQPYLHEPEVSAMYAETQEMMNVLYQCEDVRDWLNELAELATRSSGFMGTGWMAAQKVDNMAEHAKLCADAYDSLLEKHPKFKPKIEQTVGHGLAILRSKHKFTWSTMYRYFY